MRPCVRCGLALTNGASTCSACGAQQTSGLKVRPSGPAPTRPWWVQLAGELNDISPVPLILVPMFMVVVAGALVGQWLGDGVGLLLGLLVAALAILAAFTKFAK